MGVGKTEEENFPHKQLQRKVYLTQSFQQDEPNNRRFHMGRLFLPKDTIADGELRP